MAIPAAETEAIFAAVEAGDGDTVRHMVQKRADIVDAQRASDGLSLLLHAMYLGKWEMVDLIAPIHPGLDVFESAALGREKRVRHLTTTNYRLLAKTSPDGWTALHLAAFFGQIETTRVLIDQGANVNAVSENEMRNRPLHAAAAGRHFAVCELLIGNGADIDARQSGGYTALMEAALHGDRGLVELFIRRGASRDLRSDEGKTAADIAAEHGHDDVAGLLRA
jgi:ankyrin repeat protein